VNSAAGGHARYSMLGTMTGNSYSERNFRNGLHSSVQAGAEKSHSGVATCSSIEGRVGEARVFDQHKAPRRVLRLRSLPSRQACRNMALPMARRRRIPSRRRVVGRCLGRRSPSAEILLRDVPPSLVRLERMAGVFVAQNDASVSCRRQAIRVPCFRVQERKYRDGREGWKDIRGSPQERPFSKRA
jgi:hypothetical protein